MKTVIVLWTLIATVCANEFDDDYNYDYATMGDYENQLEMFQDPPAFTASPQHFSVEIDGDITFPCDVRNQGDQLLMFRHLSRKGIHKTLYVGNMSMKADGYKLIKSENSFILSEIRRRHAGGYECRIETTPVAQLNHTLNVQYPAKVTRISNAVQRVRKGSDVTLECKGRGNPKAAISWSRQQGHLPSGAKDEEGSSLTFENVDRHVEGTYICTASNGIGDPSSTIMTIEVEYPPEIIAEQATMHTDEGDEAKLLCIVHGRPAPIVTWTKGGALLNPNTHLQEHDGIHRHTLTISHVQSEDFGNYTCSATNVIGRDNRTLTVTGVPKEPEITSSPAGGERVMYTLTWMTESYSPITQYQLTYRRVKVNQSNQFQQGWKDAIYSPPTVGSRQDIPGITGSSISMSHTLDGLEPATDYEILVNVKNKFGWSQRSPPFYFNTRKEVAVGQSASGSQRLVSTVILLVTSLCVIFH